SVGARLYSGSKIFVSVTVPSLTECRSIARPNVYEFRNEIWFAERRWNLISRPLYSTYPVLDSAPTVRSAGDTLAYGRLMLGSVTPRRGGAWLRSVFSAASTVRDPEYAASTM